jgi:hypothetical protein
VDADRARAAAYKFYAPGVGIVLEISTRQGGERDELTSVH